MGLATGISVLIMTLSVAIPVLEKGTLLHHPVVEQEHAPGDCPSAHDHTICTQVGGDPPLHTSAVDASVDADVEAEAMPDGARAHHPASTDGTHHPRAPPLA